MLPTWQAYRDRRAYRFGHGCRAAPAARPPRRCDAALVPFQKPRDHQTTNPQADTVLLELPFEPHRDKSGRALRWKCRPGADCLRGLETEVRRMAAAHPVCVRAFGTAKSYRLRDERKRKACPVLRARAERSEERRVGKECRCGW